MLRPPFRIRAIFPIVILAVLAPLATVPARVAMEDSALCRDNIPSQLLMAVALVETGRWDEATERVVP